jgi:hypothetical protein
MTKEDVLPHLLEVASQMVAKVQAVGAVSRAEALKIVASASRSLAEDLDRSANDTTSDEMDSAAATNNDLH